LRHVKYKLILSTINIFFSTAFILLILWYIISFSIDRPLFGVIAVGLSMVIVSLNVLEEAYKQPSRRIPRKLWKILWVVAIIVAIYAVIYFWREYSQLIYLRAGSPTLYDLALGAMMLLLVILLSVVILGYAIPLIAIVFILIALLGSYLPGVYPLSVIRLIDSTTTDLYRGIFGELPQIGATLVAVFLILSGLMQALGSFNFIFQALWPLVRRSRRALVEIPVIASAFFGMFSGSGAANVAGTGSFTIPTMIKYNVPPKFAGAIESVASAGGQIMPPIMGVAAFLMAEYLGVPYAQIAYMAIVPSVLFFASVGFNTYFLAEKINIRLVQEDVEVRSLSRRRLLVEAIPFITALLSLVVALGVMQLDALLAGLYTIMIYVVVAIMKDLLFTIYRRGNLSSYLKSLMRKFAGGVVDTARSIGEIIIMLSCIQVIIVLMSSTGVALKLSLSLMSLGYNLLLLLVLAAVVAIILGCVVSTVAVYVLCYILVIPALLRAGMDPFIANFFIFWYAIAGLITPPVAGNVAVACRISKAGYFETAWEAMKIGISLFVIPVLFILHPELLHYDLRTPITVLISLTALYAFSSAIYGTLPEGKVLKYLLIRLSIVLLSLLIFLSTNIWIMGLITLVLLALLGYMRTIKSRV